MLNMRNTSWIFLFLFALVVIPFSTQAQTPQQTLNQYISVLQKNPHDNALREKIIKFVKKMKPAPTIPQEARRPYVKGATFMKEATSVSDYELAIKAYEETLLIAPWWPKAYYNLALAQEGAGKFDDGIQSLKLYLLTNPRDAEKAQNRMYTMEAKKEKEAKDAAKATQEEAKKIEDLVQKLAGTWFWKMNDIDRALFQMSAAGKNMFFLEWIRDSGRGDRVKPYSETYSGTVTGSRINGNFSQRANMSNWGCGMVDLSGTFDGTISEDGKRIQMVVRGPVTMDISTCSKKIVELKKEFIKE
jgi:hypothetical protein